ncbi:MAG: hypothetical protein HPY83_12510 [Anaerolineae bacterium]|nr:hypothetical protein [Anaerolineae bacterium]
MRRRPSGGADPDPTVLVTGEPGSGKTSLCRHVVARFERGGPRCGGLLWLSRSQGQRQVGRWVARIGSGQSRVLAHRVRTGDA